MYSVYAISKGSSGFYSLPVCDALGIWEYKARITCFFPYRGGKTVFAFFIEESSDIFTSFPFNTRTITCVVQEGNRSFCLSLAHGIYISGLWDLYPFFQWIFFYHGLKSLPWEDRGTIFVRLFQEQGLESRSGRKWHFLNPDPGFFFSSQIRIRDPLGKEKKKKTHVQKNLKNLHLKKSYFDPNRIRSIHICRNRVPIWSIFNMLYMKINKTA